MNDLYIDELNLLLQQRVPGGRVIPQNLPGCEEIALLLIDPKTIHSNYSAEDITTIMHRPAYWALCWSSGLALAKFILDHRTWLQGKRVVDFGSGSGVVAIAAAMAGAGQGRL